jgi:hypothetical protein
MARINLIENDNTKKAYLSSIPSVIKHIDTLNSKKAYQEVRDWALEQIKNINEGSPPNNGGEKTKKQSENWISWEGVIEKRNELEELTKTFGHRLTRRQFHVLQQYMTLSLYTMVPPRRIIDYLKMFIVRKYNPEKHQKHNYLSLEDNKFIFNLYKTSKTYGRQELEFGEDLKKVIDLYLKYYPSGWGKRSDNEPLFVDYFGEKLTLNNSVTRIINRIFSPKKISVSMLRHIYLSDKYGEEKEAMSKDAEAMGHSVSEQREYIKK